ncbi:MAG: thioredoxin family protein [Candidatus Marinimicrobia bacterium]|nr:thioredoxin family protein [Candidatus Neomarinimicrobiota bacterium]
MRFSGKQTKLFTVFTVLFLTAALTLTACSPKDSAEAKATGSKKVSGTQAAEDLPKMVDFKSPTCPPCRAMEPILEELKEEYAHAFELEVVDVSLSENRDRAVKHAIQYIPTQIFYDADGEQIFRHTGYYSREDILKKWKELGYDMSSP